LFIAGDDFLASAGVNGDGKDFPVESTVAFGFERIVQ